MATGIVKWFSDKKGYGFIENDDGAKKTLKKATDYLVSPPFPLPNATLIAIETTQAEAGFQDYLGITVGTGPEDPCGNGTCDPPEHCGYSDSPEDVNACVTDCELCTLDEACDSDGDCDTGRCENNVCRRRAFVDVNALSCDKECAFGGECLTGVCNVGFCTAEHSLPPGKVCTTDDACRSGSCSTGPFGLAGVCVERCGDEFCDGLELPGGDDEGLACGTDCGKIPNGSLCPGGDESCESGVCDGVYVEELGYPLPHCIEPNSKRAGAICGNNNACLRGYCRFGTCRPVCGDTFCDAGLVAGGLFNEECGTNDSGTTCKSDCGRCGIGHLCSADEVCESDTCVGLHCAECKPNGPRNFCIRDGQCCSGRCAVTCRACKVKDKFCVRHDACCSGKCTYWGWGLSYCE